MDDDKCEYCKAPLWHELHDGWHKLKAWNDDVFAGAKLKAMKEFEGRIPKKTKPKEKDGWTSLDM